MRYYTIQNNSILTANTEQALTRYYTNVQVLPEDYIEGKYVIVDGELILNENYEAEQAQKEAERVAKLNMTRGDFIEGLILAQGKDEQDIIALIEVLPISDIEKKVYINRVKNALDFFRGYPVIDVLCEYLGLSTEQMTMFFETKDYKHLIIKPVEPPVEDTTEQVTKQVEEPTEEPIEDEVIEDENTTDTTES